MSVGPSLLQQLEERISALEQRATGVSEPWTPTYLTSQPDGTVGATFTGLVKALGLILPASVTGIPGTAANQIVWERADGAVEARLSGGNEELTLDALALAAADESLVGIFARDDQGTAQARLQVIQAQRGTLLTEVLLGAGANDRVGIDSTGRSDFLQLLATQKLQLAFGIAGVVFPNSATATPLAVAHGLGRAPQVVLLTPAYTPFGQQTFTATAYGAVNFTLNGSSSVALNSTNSVAWVAIG